MTSTRIDLGATVPEKSSRTYSVTIKDQDGLPVPLASMTSITATLRDEATGFLLRSDHDVKNANDGTFGTTDGLFSLFLTELDNRIVNPRARRNTFEKRVLTLDFVYSESRETREVEYSVEALADIR